MFRYPLLIALALAALLSGGCFGGSELDNSTYVLAIGVDKAAEPGMYVFTYRLAKPETFVGEGGGDQEKTMLVSVKAPSLDDGSKMLAIAVNRHIETGHATSLLVHEDVAQEGLSSIIMPLMNNRKYRNNMNLMVTKDKTEDVLEKNKAPFEVFPSRYVDSMVEMERMAGSYNLRNIGQFVLNMRDPSHASMAVYGTVVGDTLGDAPPSPLPGHITPRYRLDEFPRKGGTELVVAGTAIFRDWKMVGALDTTEAFGATILDKGLQSVTLSVEDPVRSGSIVSFSMDAPRPRVTVALADGQMKINVTVHAEVQITEIGKNINYNIEANRALLTQRIEQAIEDAVQSYFHATQPLGADCLMLSRHYAPQLSSWQEWAKLDWPQLYQDADVRVTAKVSIRRPGLLWRQAPVSSEKVREAE